MSGKKRIRKKVDPLTGKASTADNAISYAAFKNRSKVDPKTGKSSTADNAISSSAFRKRRKVDPLTGEPSKSDDAITLRAFYNRKKVEPYKATAIEDASSSELFCSKTKKRTISEVAIAKRRDSYSVGNSSIQSAKRPKFSFVIDKFVSNVVIGTANGIKTEVDDYRLDF